MSFSEGNEGLWKDGQVNRFDEEQLPSLDEHYSKHCSSFLEWGKPHNVPSIFAPQSSHSVSSLSSSLETINENKSFPCDTCGKMYKLSTSLHTHKKFECGKEPLFKCLFCPLRTFQKGSMKRHMKRIHNTDALPLNFSVCENNR